MDQLFPEARTEPGVQLQTRLGNLAALLDTLAEIPPELLTLSGDDLVDYHVSRSFMRTALE